MCIPTLLLYIWIQFFLKVGKYVWTINWKVNLTISFFLLKHWTFYDKGDIYKQFKIATGSTPLNLVWMQPLYNKLTVKLMTNSCTKKKKDKNELRRAESLTWKLTLQRRNVRWSFTMITGRQNLRACIEAFPKVNWKEI